MNFQVSPDELFAYIGRLVVEKDKVEALAVALQNQLAEHQCSCSTRACSEKCPAVDTAIV